MRSNRYPCLDRLDHKDLHRYRANQQFFDSWLKLAVGAARSLLQRRLSPLQAVAIFAFVMVTVRSKDFDYKLLYLLRSGHAGVC
ncbi:hypothetical protein MLPF_3227 [Mycobacterium lepromatosis]|nr:hypothetical protein MLPF_3227 [Mycobacterium lepromatosis]